MAVCQFSINETLLYLIYWVHCFSCFSIWIVFSDIILSPSGQSFTNDKLVLLILMAGNLCNANSTVLGLILYNNSTFIFFIKLW